MKTYGFIGCGNMGGILASCAAGRFGESVLLLDHNREKTEKIAAKFGARTANLTTIAAGCDYIFLGVKPNALKGLLEELRPLLHDGAVIVSMAAGVALQTIEQILGTRPIIRIMPNTPSACGEGVVLYSPNAAVTPEQIEDFREALADAGCVEVISEDKIDAASALSGCGPAFVYMFIEALADGAVKCGLPRDKALHYAAQTVLGAGKYVLESGMHPGILKDGVCSPGGSTIAGVATLESAAFRGAVMAALEASYKRTKELG